MKIIKAVPTNIITGALGAGKTTVIQKLLESKPKEERWAVLVNEFGEIGIDAALLGNQRIQSGFQSKANHKQNAGIFIREVPGGCMCCTSSLPMHIALNQLLAAAKPDRLLIEPTGLGHPKEVIETLDAEHYKDVINLQSILCAVDARKLKNKKWREHATFREQFEVADSIIITKADLYTGTEIGELRQYLSEIACEQKTLVQAVHGKIDKELIESSSHFTKTKAMQVIGQSPSTPDKNIVKNKNGEAALAQKSDNIIKRQSSGEGFYSCGWIWPPQHVFDFARLESLFASQNCTRIKGIMITSTGIFGFNARDNELSISQYDDAMDSRLEIICDSKEALASAVKLIEASL